MPMWINVLVAMACLVAVILNFRGLFDQFSRTDPRYLLRVLSLPILIFNIIVHSVYVAGVRIPNELYVAAALFMAFLAMFYAIATYPFKNGN